MLRAEDAVSRSFYLVCRETREYVWIGQGYCALEPPHAPDMTVFYSGDEKVIESLGRFLRKTQGKPLIVLDSEDVPIDCVEFGTTIPTTEKGT